jgi:hypothetical protein
MRVNHIVASSSYEFQVAINQALNSIPFGLFVQEVKYAAASKASNTEYSALIIYGDIPVT